MPDLYRAPEMLLGLPWSFPVDVWSIGVMVCYFSPHLICQGLINDQTLELLEGRNLFDPIDRTNDQYVRPWALAQYIGYIGHPPQNMVQQSPINSLYFDRDGKSITPMIPLPTKLIPCSH